MSGPFDRSASPAPLAVRSASPAPAAQGPAAAGPRGHARGFSQTTSPALKPQGVPRSMSPGPYGGGPNQVLTPPLTVGGRPRSNSAGDASRGRAGAPGPSPMNPNARPAVNGSPVSPIARVASPAQSTASTVTRKPVPGQAA